MVLEILIRKLPDGRFKISYQWHWWESYNREYFENEEALAKFLQNLITKTKYEGFIFGRK